VKDSPQALERVVLREPPLDVGELAQYQSASRVRVAGSTFKATDLSALAVLPHLTHLEISGARVNLGGLANLQNLRSLSLDDPRTLDGLESLTQLKDLTVYCFSHIRSLAPVGKLAQLEKLYVSTPPSYDASRKCHEVESLAPISDLKQLCSLVMRGTLPDDRTLKPLHTLTQLETLEITHVYCFGLEDYASLALALPKTTGHCLQPYFEANWAPPCRKCGRRRVVLTGPPPRCPRFLCPDCNSAKLAQHVDKWEAIAGVRSHS